MVLWSHSKLETRIVLNMCGQNLRVKVAGGGEAGDRKAGCREEEEDREAEGCEGGLRS